MRQDISLVSGTKNGFGIKLNEIVIFGNALLLMVPHPEIEAMSEQQSLRSAMQPVYPSP
jgi:hypothetical protein